MGDAEDLVPPSKKRVAGRQLSRENPELDDDEDVSEQETGTFKRASDEVLANRRIVKVRRNPTSSTPSAPSSNPFAGIRLVPPTFPNVTPAAVTPVPESEKAASEVLQSRNNVDSKEQSESKVDEPQALPTADEEKKEIVNEVRKPESADEEASKAKESENEAKESENETKESENEAKESENEAKESENETKESGNEAKESGNEAKESENEAKEDVQSCKDENEDKQDAGDEKAEKSTEAASVSSFGQLSSTQNAFTGFAGTGFSSSTFSFGSISKGDQPSVPSFGFGLPTNGSSSLFGNLGGSSVDKGAGSKIPSMQEVPVETGEENEKAVFTADSVLFEFLDGAWKERGKGELKVNVSTTGTGKARLVMRARGNYRLILNAMLFADMKLANMDKRGITFACINSTGEAKDGGLTTFALKFKDASVVEEFRAVVTEHKGGSTAPIALKTPENSPKATDE